MKKYLILPLLLVFVMAPRVLSQTYTVAAIPDSLKQNAHFVLRDFTTVAELKSSNSGTEKIRKVITVLDKTGEKDAYLLLHYDKYSSVNIKQITIFDSNGKKSKSVKQSEINDYPAYRSFELYSDQRVKYYQPENPEFPYTIIYEYETTESNLISFGRWMPADDYNMSVEHASYTLKHPARLKVNVKEIGTTIKSHKAEDNLITDIWELNNIKAIDDEPFDPGISELSACVYIMPSVLSFNRYDGSSDTWEGYGKWAFSLYDGRDEISLEQNIKLNALLKDVNDTIEKIRILYKYLQDNTRYVAVTLGIGGYQPFEASSVFKNGYGECKALSNYMYSMLKFAGIKSYPALVSAGSYKTPVFRDFPNFSQLNHVIVCVPHGRDTIWLECTDQKIPFGFLGDFTDDRDVLLLTEKGGKFAHTTKYDEKDNLRSNRSEFLIDSTGKADYTNETKFFGLQYDDLAAFLRSNTDEQKKWLYTNSILPSLQIKSFKVSELPGRVPLVKLNESGVSANFCTFSGKYMVLPLNLVNPQKVIQKMMKPRHSDILIIQSSTDTDTLIYKLPESYSPESLPRGVILNSAFGTYSSTIALNGNEIHFTRRYEIKRGRYKPSDYKAFYDYILAVSKADNAKVLLTKK